MDPMRRKILAGGAAAAAMAAAPRHRSADRAGSSRALLRERPRSHSLRGGRFRFPALAHRRRRLERLDDRWLAPGRSLQPD